MIEIKERVELINKLLEVKRIRNIEAIPTSCKELTTNKIKALLMTVLKEILFKYYSSIGNLQAHYYINNRSKEYQDKINQQLIEEGYMIREEILETIDTFSSNRDLDRHKNYKVHS